MARLSTHDETVDPATATHGNRLRVVILFYVIPKYKKSIKNGDIFVKCIFFDKYCNFILKFSVPVIVRQDSLES